MSSSLKFKCPNKSNKCKSNRVEEVMVNVVQSSTIDYIDEEGYVDYENTSTDGGEVDRYQCSQCGYVLKTELGGTINTPEDLVEWLKGKGMLK